MQIRRLTHLHTNSKSWLLAPVVAGALGLGACDSPKTEQVKSADELVFRTTSGPLSCEGLSCTQSQTPLPDEGRFNVQWNPCDGGEFTWELDAQFENGYDYIGIGDRWFSGPLNGRSGTASGTIVVGIRTDYSVQSPGISSLTATCADNGGSTGGDTGSGGGDTGSGPTVTSGPLSCTGTTCRSESPLGNAVRASVQWNPCNGGGFSYTGQASFERYYDFLFVDNQRFTGPGQNIQGQATGPISVRIFTDYSVQSGGLSSLVATCNDNGSTDTGTDTTSDDPGYLTCSGLRCETQNTLPNNLEVERSWDPCDGGAFTYSGEIALERGYDLLHIGGVTHTGTQTISGQAEGEVRIALSTDYSRQSRGILNLEASCVDDGSSSTGSDESTTGSTSDSSDSSSSSTDTTTTEPEPEPEPEPELSCEALSCTSFPSPLPGGEDLRVNRWDPCNGRAFSVSGSIDLEQNGGERDHLQIGALFFSGDREIQANFEGPISLNLVTTARDNNLSTGIESLTANCSPENFGLVCEGLNCRSEADLLPGEFQDELNWDPCDGGPFTWTGQISTEANQDFVTVDGNDFSGVDRNISGSSEGEITLSIRTNRFGDSVGLRSLQATCTPRPVPFPGLLMTDWSADEVRRYNQTSADFIGSRGINFLSVHAQWHGRNDVGGRSGDQGPGSGMAFLGMHRAMINAFQNFANANPNRVPARPINGYADLPAGLADARESHSRVGNAPASWYSPRSRSSYRNSGVGIPRFLMIGGGGAGSATAIGNSYRLKNDRDPNRAGLLITRLEQFQEPDEVGEAIGRSGYHARGHWWIGGTMGVVYSPLDPVFWGWHLLIDDIFQNWLDNTENGRRWRDNNPNHPILDRESDNMNQWRDLRTTLTHGGVTLR